MHRELDELNKQVSSLANFNYAREPDFVRDRKKVRETVDEVAPLSRYITSRHLEPFIDRLGKTQDLLASEARKHEEQSEIMAKEFLSGRKSYDEFMEEYIAIRKQTSARRIQADKLAKERDRLAEILNKPIDSPVPTPRQRKKRVSFTPK